jgi:hypothetical protein
MDIFVGVSFLRRYDSFDILSGLMLYIKNMQLNLFNLHMVDIKMGRLSALEINLFSIFTHHRPESKI